MRGGSVVRGLPAVVIGVVLAGEAPDEADRGVRLIAFR
jgi:hypothetical protein